MNSTAKRIPARNLFHDTLLLLETVILLTVLSDNVLSDMVDMKIVDEPSSYGYAGMNNFYQPQEQSLKMRIKPANFSGPPHLKRLLGKCFTKTEENYKYKFCPFYNVSQHEQSLRWNPYNGVLGVWQDWEIENNTFIAMLLREGDSCGEKFRSVRVVLICGNKSEITNVTETKTCEYELQFKTPLVCHHFAMLVYPVLTPDQKDRWNQLESLIERKEITQKGYMKKLNKIFEDAGLYISAKTKQYLTDEVNGNNAMAEQHKTGNSETLEQCKQELTELKEEIARLKTLLKVNGTTEGLHNVGDIENNVHAGNQTDVNSDLKGFNNTSHQNSTH